MTDTATILVGEDSSTLLIDEVEDIKVLVAPSSLTLVVDEEVESIVARVDALTLVIDNEAQVIGPEDITLITTAATGPRGEQGPRGGVARFYGERPPATVIGASINDEYVDTLTGILYVLQEG